MSRRTPETDAATPPPAPRWRASVLLSSPHRLCFLAAGAQWVLSASWWVAALLTGADGRFALDVVPASAWHGLWFSLGAMPLFVAGFLFTAGPRWLHTTTVDARQLGTGIGLFSAGWLLALPFSWLDHRAMAAMLFLAAVGQLLLVARAWGLLRLGRRGERLHAGLITLAMAAMALTLSAAALAIAVSRIEWLLPLARAGLWCGPVLVFLAASHRMLPFLGDGLWPALDRRWPNWPLWLLASLVPAQAADALSAGGVASPVWWPALRFGHLAVVCAASAGLILRWVGHPAMRTAMLRMLFGAALWWVTALALATAAAFPGLHDAWARTLELAGLHALGMGYLGGTLLTMATRVSATHQGRARAIDGIARWLYAALQMALVARLSALVNPNEGHLWLPAAAMMWGVVAGGWLLQHGRWLGQAPAVRGPLPRRSVIAIHDKP